MKIQRCIDALVSVGKPVSQDDHILHILAGLSSEYESMIFVISTRTDSHFIQDIVSLLLTQETRIENKISYEGALPYANLTSNTTKK